MYLEASEEDEEPEQVGEGQEVQVWELGQGQEACQEVVEEGEGSAAAIKYAISST